MSFTSSEIQYPPRSKTFDEGFLISNQSLNLSYPSGYRELFDETISFMITSCAFKV